MTSPEGGFYSALDADSDGEEGTFLRLDRQGARRRADRQGRRWTCSSKVYGADEKPNFEEKYHILVLSRPLAEAAKE